jgi:hypothetical protein
VSRRAAKKRKDIIVKRSFLAFAIVWIISPTVMAQAQTREAALAALHKLPAAERQAKLAEGAKKESGLVWYSSTKAEDALAMIK